VNRRINLKVIAPQVLKMLQGNREGRQVPQPLCWRFAVLSHLKSLQKQLVAAKRKEVVQYARDQCCRSRVFNEHGWRRTVQRCNGFEHYRRSRILAKARRGSAHSGRANDGHPQTIIEVTGHRRHLQLIKDAVLDAQDLCARTRSTVQASQELLQQVDDLYRSNMGPVVAQEQIWSIAPAVLFTAILRAS